MEEKAKDLIGRLTLEEKSSLMFDQSPAILKAFKPLLINEQYTAVHGKKYVCTNSANEVVISFENPSKEN